MGRRALDRLVWRAGLSFALDRLMGRRALHSLVRRAPLNRLVRRGTLDRLMRGAGLALDSLVWRARLALDSLVRRARLTLDRFVGRAGEGLALDGLVRWAADCELRGGDVGGRREDRGRDGGCEERNGEDG